MRIGFIGLGNMAKAIIGGILKQGLCEPSDIYGADVSADAVKEATEKLSINAGMQNAVVAQNADILFLAVKPQYMDGALQGLKAMLLPGTIVISIAPGKTIAWLEERLGSNCKIVRCMPNTPALVGEGSTAACINSNVTETEMEKVIKLLQSFGKASLVPEHLMDVVVGISGSSPAYAFMFIEAMADAAVKGGMPRQQAYEFSAQALLGSAKMVLETKKHPGELKDMVCSPGGTTIEAVAELERGNFRATVIDAVEACIEKSKSL